MDYDSPASAFFLLGFGLSSSDSSSSSESFARFPCFFLSTGFVVFGAVFVTLAAGLFGGFSSLSEASPSSDDANGSSCPGFFFGFSLDFAGAGAGTSGFVTGAADFAVARPEKKASLSS